MSKSPTTKTKTKTESNVKIAPLEIGVIKVKIQGISPYLPSPIDEEALKKYEGSKGAKGKPLNVNKKTEEEKAKEKYYYTETGKYGIPARAFYMSMIRASTYFYEKSEGGMRNIKENVTVMGDILPITYKEIKQVVHWGRQAGKTKMPIRIIRNAFIDWKTEITIQYNKNKIIAGDIINILNHAGFLIGVGGFRKEKTGNFGMFGVTN